MLETTKKRKQKDTKMDLSSDDGSSEAYCFVCVATYSDSGPNEKWIQWFMRVLDTCCSHFLTIIAGVDLHFRHESECTACKEWAHEKCINILHSGSLFCRNCDSYDSDFDY